MKKITITTQFTAYKEVNELPDDIQNIMKQAIAVRKMLTLLLKISVG
jgi:cytidine deaminase